MYTKVNFTNLFRKLAWSIIVRPMTFDMTVCTNYTSKETEHDAL